MSSLFDNSSYKESISLSIRRVIDRQSVIDLENSVVVPIMDIDNIEFIVDKNTSKVVPVSTHSVMFRSSTAIIFDAHTMVLKYQSDCLRLGQVHPLIREYWLVDKLVDTNISMEVYYLSPPARFNATSESSKSSFDMSDQDRQRCTNNGFVRVIAMAKGGIDLEMMIKTQFVSGFGLISSIRLMIQLIEKIQHMHALGVIHGDIHPGNIVTLIGQDLQDVRLVDFGNGLFQDELSYEPELQREPLSVTIRYSSPWNLAGIVPSFRDDVYRALLVGAMAINGKAYLTFCEMLEWYPPVMFRFKHQYMIFQLPGGDNFLINVRQDVRDKVREGLERALNISRSVDNMYEKPDYHSILYELRFVYNIVHQSLINR